MMVLDQIPVIYNPQYDLLDNILEDIHSKCIRIETSEKKALSSRFNGVIDTFINTMREVDDTFNEVFNRIGYTGSFYEGVRVAEATEFDLNVILNLNLNLDIDKESSHPGFVGIKVKTIVSEKPIKSWIVNGLLDPNRVKQWLEGVVAKTLSALEHEVGDCRIRFVKGGPAITLIVSSCSSPQKDISIDLVPVIAFPSSKWPHHCPRKPKRFLFFTYQEPWYVVPKGVNTWRVSFPIQEQRIVKGLYFLKYTLRFLKKLRDELNMNCIASYYIKTLFLWEIEKNKDRDIWSRNKGRLFFHMVVKLNEALADKNLPFFWNADYNLFSNLKMGTLRNYHGKLNQFINKINNFVASRDKIGLNNYMTNLLMSQWEQERADESNGYCAIL